MKISAGVAIVSGMTSLANSIRMVAEQAQDWQAFWGIIFGAVTVIVFVWATMKNQKRQDAKFDEWKRHNDVVENGKEDDG